MKNTKYFNFKPDDHYGFPEINEMSDHFISGLSLNDLLKFYEQADCSAFAMEGGNPDEMSDIFLEYGNYDLYGYFYVCIYDTDDETFNGLVQESYAHVEDNIISNGEINGCNEEFMKYLSEKDEIDIIFSFPSPHFINSNSEFMIYKDGSRINNTISDYETTPVLTTEVLPKLSDSIIADFKNPSKRISAGRLYNMINKIFPSLDDLLSQSLTPEEILSLRNIGKGASMLSRFGRR